MVGPIRLLWLLVGVVLVPVLPSMAADFKCEEQAFDLRVCDDPKDPATCPQVCSLPPDSETCALLPLPVLSSTERQTDGQPILRRVSVQEGPFLGVVLALSAFSVADDNVFSRGRNFLCVSDTTGDGGGSNGDGVSGGGVSGGLDPRLRGGDAGVRGGDPGLRGPNQ